jgi:hypothetical protein
VEKHSFGDTDYNSDFIWEDMDNDHAQHELFSGHSKKKSKLRGHSLQANYTDWVTAACRRS